MFAREQRTHGPGLWALSGRSEDGETVDAAIILKSLMRMIASMFWLIVIALVLAKTQALAQQVLIHGVLRDNSGHPASNASLKLSTPRGALLASTRADHHGQFSLTAPFPGRFTLSVTLPSGQKSRPQTIEVPAGRPLSLCIRLQAPGRGVLVQKCEPAKSVPVASREVKKANTGQSLEGGNLSSQQVSSLPLNGRDFSQLLHLVAGTMTDTNGAANFTQQFAVNGQRGTAAVFAMDGVYTSDPEMGGATFDNFNVDAIEEVHSETGVLPAEIGAGAASYTDVITKSGTSDEHGDAFEFVRNSVLDARNFFDRRTPATPGRLPHFERNEFGVTNGGPLIIPGLYDGRGRTYYFGEYQGFRQVLGTTQILSVPTVTERMGLDTTAFPGDTLMVPVSPAVAPVLARYPLPNDPSGPYGPRTYAASAPVVTNSNQFSLRVDHRASDHSQFFGRFTYDDIDGPLTNPDQTAIDPSFAVNFYDHERNVALGYTRTLSPNLTWQTHLDFIRATPVYPTLNTTQPALLFGDGLYEPFNAPGGSITGAFGNLYQLRQDWVDVHGSHTLKIGGQFRWNVDTTIFGISPNGQFQFGGGTAYARVPITSQSGNHNIAVGQPLPDALSGFLSGAPYSYTSAVAYPLFPQGSHIGESAIRRQGYNLYVQDSWKATRNLTLDYGLRYEVETPIYEIHDLTSGPLFVGANGQQTVPWAPGVKEEMLFNPQPPYRMDWNCWGPRLSVAYRLSDKTTVHAGGSIVTILTNLWQDNFLTGGMPIVLNPYIAATQGTAIPFANTTIPLNVPPIYTPQGKPVFATPVSTAAPANTVMDVTRFEQDLASATPGGQSNPLTIEGISRDFRNGSIDTYTAGFEHQFSDVTLDVDYVATMGIHLASVLFPNAYGGASRAWAPFTNFNAAGDAVGGYGPENLVGNGSHSTYHSLQASVSKTSARAGLGFQLSYTYSKALDDTSSVLAGFSNPTLGTILQAFSQDPRSPSADKGPANFDLTHVLAFSLVQRLPFDHIGFLRPLGSPLTAGWEFLSVSSITSGPPFSVFSGIQQTAAGTFNADRPDQRSEPVFSTSRKIQEDYFGRGANNASYFQIPVDVPGGSGPNQGVFGTLGRDTYRGPGYTDFDVALIKDTPLGHHAGHEAATLEFRSEFFNVFNFVNFAIPANIVRGSGFGYINHTSGSSRQLQFSLKIIY
jgi:Carboxypeptidase regulatory-like domain/TonB dependent receptor-like, beta-barrel